MHRVKSPGRAARLQRQIGTAAPASGAGVRRFGSIVLGAYWIGCLGVIGLGLDRLYPDVRATLTRPAMAPAFVADVADRPVEPRWSPRYDRPFRNCAAAHAAGVYDIPLGTPAYSPHQDGDDDGLACEPPRGLE